MRGRFLAAVAFGLIAFSTPLRADVNDIAVDATASGTCPLVGGKSANCTSFTIAMTVGTGSNRVLIAGAAVNGHDITPTLTWTVGATVQTLTSIGHFHGTGGGSDNDALTMYSLLSPTSGAGTLTVSITGAGQKMAAGAIDFINVSQTTPTTTSNSNGTTSSATPSITVNTGDRHVVTDVMSNSTGSTNVSSVGTAQTLEYAIDTNNGNGGGGETGIAASGKPGCLTGGNSPCPTTTTMSWTLSATDKWEIIATDLTPATSVSLLSLKLRDFKAARCGNTTTLNWKTSFEARNAGFHVIREIDGKRERATHSLIGGSALFSTSGTLASGRAYSWKEPNHPGAEYWLEEVDTSGAHSMHGPVVPEDRCAVPGIAMRSIAAPPPKTADVTPTSTRRRAVVAPAPATLPKQWALAAAPALKLSVNRDGWYRVTAAELRVAGLNPNADPRNLQLYADGMEQAINVTGAGDVEFYGTGTDSYWTDIRVYWLVDGGNPGKRIAVQDARADASGAAGSFRTTVTHLDRSAYYAALTTGDGENLFGSAITADPVEEVVAVKRIDPAATDATIEVALQGVSAGNHAVNVKLNGTPIGNITFDNLLHTTASFALSSSLLREGDNAITFSSAGSEDISAVDHVSVTYWHAMMAEGDALTFPAGAAPAVSVGGFSSADIRVFDITDAANVHELLGSTQPSNGGFTVAVETPTHGANTLLALTNAQVLHPESMLPNKPSSIHAVSNGGALLIIAHGSLVPALAPLQAAHAARGLTTTIVDVEDIYDEFSFGQKDPMAIKRFLSAARSWQEPPRYVLLAGDSSFDPKNELGMGDFDLVPSHFVATNEIETMSDDWFVDFENDGLPDLPIGRFAARTPDQAAAMVAKTVAFLQAAPAAWSRQALLVADANDSSYDFERESATLAALLPSTMTTVIDRLGNGVSKTQFLSQLNAGAGLVEYLGHGSVEEWSAEEILTSDDAPSLTNGPRTPFVVALTCLNGLFQDVYTTSLAEALMNAPNGGAVAVWASASLTRPAEEAAAGEQLLSILYGGTQPAIGDAILAAKRQTTSADVRSSFVLFGDPALRLP